MDDGFATIYGLVDPRTGYLRYIGQTIADVRARFVNHLMEKPFNLSGPGPKTRWLQELKQANLRPRLIVLDRVPAHLAHLTEYHYLLAARSIGCPLVNTAYRAHEGHARFVAAVQDELTQLAPPLSDRATARLPISQSRPYGVRTSINHELFGQGEVLDAETEITFTVRFDDDGPGAPPRRIVMRRDNFTGFEKDEVFPGGDE